MGSTTSVRYTGVAIALHWLIALCVFGLLAVGFWMTDAIEEEASRQAAFTAYQWHKTFGIMVLLLTALRLVWRLTHRAPPLPPGMPAWQQAAAKVSHWGFYALTLAVPLAGWAMVSASPYGFPTMLFGVIEWPHIGPLTRVADKQAVAEALSETHEYLAIALLVLIGLHVAAAVKHQWLDRDGLLARMLPFLARKDVA